MNKRNRFLIVLLLAALVSLIFICMPVIASADEEDAQTLEITGEGAGFNAGSKVSMSQTSVRTKKATYPYTGKQVKPNPVVTYQSKELTKDKDYTVSYRNNIQCGIAAVTVTGMGKFSGSVSRTYRIGQRNINDCRITGIQNLTYTGAYLKQPNLKVTFKVGKKDVTLKEGTDYYLVYSNNKNASKESAPASVTVWGKGNFTGFTKKTFQILKGYPGLRFEKKEYSHTNVGTFTHAAMLTNTKEKLPVRYKSSDKNIATVDKKTGKITLKKVGTATITASVSNEDNFHDQSVSYKLKVRPIKWKGLRYSFHNYSKPYIPLSTFQLFYDSLNARNYYDKYSDIGDGGCCFGFASSVILFKMKGTGVNLTDFRSSATVPYSLKMTDKHRKTSIPLSGFIEAVHTSQLSYGWTKIYWKNADDLDALAKAVSSGEPVLISVRSAEGGGHAILGYRLKKIESGKYYLYAYDSNYPERARCIVLTKKNGKFTDWKYNLYGDVTYSSKKGGRISFMKASDYKAIWKDRSAARSLCTMMVSANNFEILNTDGDVIAEYKDGEFTTEDDRILLCTPADAELKDQIVYLPGNIYSVRNTGEAGEAMELTAMTGHQSLTVCTTADTVRMNVRDGSFTSKAVFTAEKDEPYDVTVLKTGAGGLIREFSFIGTGTGEEVTLGTEKDTCVINGASGVKLTIDGEEAAITQ